MKRSDGWIFTFSMFGCRRAGIAKNHGAKGSPLIWSWWNVDNISHALYMKVKRRVGVSIGISSVGEIQRRRKAIVDESRVMCFVVSYLFSKPQLCVRLVWNNAFVLRWVDECRVSNDRKLFAFVSISATQQFSTPPFFQDDFRNVRGNNRLIFPYSMISALGNTLEVQIRSVDFCANDGTIRNN